MIENQEQLLFSQDRLEKLKSWEKRAVDDLTLDPRLKESKLAGIRGIMAEIEREIRVYNMSRLQNTLEELEERAQKISVEQLPVLLSQTIRAMRELTNTLQPVM
jgi:hypothetical protein